MSTEIKLMTEPEVKILKMRLYANPTTFVDPEVVRRLVATMEAYHAVVEQVMTLEKFIHPQVVL